MTYESYLATADRWRAHDIAATESPFAIEVRFLGGLTPSQQQAFAAAADRWTTMIVGDLPAVQVDGEAIDDLLILAQGVPIDGLGRILGQAGPTHLRPAGAGSAAFLPAKGVMSFDTADLEQMEQAGTLGDVITHEMGHVLGVGTVWPLKGMLQGAGTINPTFTGAAATSAYGELRGGTDRPPVPAENTGGAGTRDSHWRESVFRNELMSGFIAAADNPISTVTVGSLGDLGYDVDLEAAEPYELPDLMALAEEGLLAVREGPYAEGLVLPNIPTVLPETALVG